MNESISRIPPLLDSSGVIPQEVINDKSFSTKSEKLGVTNVILSKTWVVIPAYNEEQKIADVVREVLSYGYQVVVVDDCSTDQTLASLEGLSAHILSHPVNLGQGASIQTGITYALRCNAEYIVTFDADGQHQADEIQRVLNPLVNSRADVTLGSRFCAQGQAFNIPPSRKLLLKTAVLMARLSTGLTISDTHNGFRGFTRSAASKLDITQNRMAHASEILSQIARQKLKHIEVPVTIEYTKYSLDKGQKMSNAFNILWEQITGLLRQ